MDPSFLGGVAMRAMIGMTAVSLTIVVCATIAHTKAQEPEAKIRIGTYDNRAIVIAYAHSRFQIDDVAKKKAELDQAQAAGDEKKVQEAKQWDENRQREFHIQGFSRALVGDLLKPLQKEIDQLAARLNLSAIAGECDFHAAGVEIVDITDELVALYDPDERTLRNVAGIRQVDPVSLAQTAMMDPND
jgi:hypothetical protein